MVTVTMHCNLRPPDIAPSFSAHNAPVHQFRKRKGCFNNRWVLSFVFWPNLYCACAETIISELSGEILTLPVESANPICYIFMW